MKKFLMSKILEQVSGERSKVSNMAAAVLPASRQEAEDMFKLPPLPKKPKETLSGAE